MRRWGFVGAAMLLVVATSGCWLQPGGDAGRSGLQGLETALSPSNVAGIDQAWSKNTAEGASAPVVWNGRVFVGAGDTMFALDSGTGSLLWKTRVGDDDNPGGVGTPAVLGDNLVAPAIFLGTGGRATFDPVTGNVTNNFTFHHSDVNAPAVAPNVTAQIESDFAPGNFLTTISYGQAKAGFIDFSTTSPAPVSGPAVAGGTVAVLSGQFIAGFPVGSCPNNAQIPQWCAPLFHVDLGANGGTPVAIDSTHFAVSLVNGTTKVVNAGTGAIEWTASSGSTAAQPPAIDGHGNFYVGTADGKVRRYPVAGCASATCAATWTGNAGSAITSQPTVANDVVYVGTATKVVAFTPTTCTSPCAPAVLATADLLATSVIPVVNNGFIYAVASTGKVVAFKLFS